MSTRQSKPHRRCSIASNEKHFVEHNYHDHYYDPVIVEPAADINGSQKRRVHRGGVATPFPEKLHFMLSRVDFEGASHIVSWQPHGRCFIVHKPKEFVEKIMPKFFKQTKLTSFQRQLNLYGFSRLTAGVDRGGYYHELFIRGRMDLCRQMSRIRVKGNGSKGASSPETEPNFYAMVSCSETAPCVSREDVTAENVSSFDVIPDDPQDQDNPSGIIGLSFEMQTPMEFLSNSSDDCSRMSRTSTYSSMTSPESPIPIVSPQLPPRKMVSAPSSTDLGTRYPIPCEVSVDDVHSGDMLIFEGLPFHYLETKDVEDSLLLDI
eukprot:scaffold1996_cov127-Cylindrotheca_fusiformis.AAC.14